ncbi:hypothetical protein [Acinetobacter pittii]|uniref:hypothetical protein n=1 Tax=Acinetobacter pittii TaxID=48296 RepID=UPI003890AE73
MSQRKVSIGGKVSPEIKKYYDDMANRLGISTSQLLEKILIDNLTLSKVQILIDDFDTKVDFLVELFNQNFTNQAQFIEEKINISNSNLAKLISENGLNRQTEEFIATLTFLQAAYYKNLPIVKDFNKRETTGEALFSQASKEARDSVYKRRNPSEV